MKQCSIPGCAKVSYCRGWCTRHYQCWRRHGDPNHPTLRAPHQTTATAHTYLGFHTVHWDPTIWATWLRDRFEDHPHKAHLAGGIAEFRALLVKHELKSVKVYP